MLLAEQASLCSAIICAGDYTCKNVCYSRSDSNTIQIHTQHAYLSWGPQSVHHHGRKHHCFFSFMICVT